jgi:hypothetical protein
MLILRSYFVLLFILAYMSNLDENLRDTLSYFT